MTSCSRDDASPELRSAAIQPLILYSSLPEDRIRAVTAAYTEVSGVVMHYMLDTESVLIDKLVRKAHRPTADVLLISDVGQLVAAVEADVLRPTGAASIKQHIPTILRDPDDYWFGISARAVTIVYDRKSVNPAMLSGYAALGDEDWYGQVCMLSSATESSRTLVASLIADLGEFDAELAVRGLQKNLADPVFANGRDLLLALEAGRCQVGIVDSNAAAEFLAENLMTNISLHWPSASDGGVVLSLTGAGVTRHAANSHEAVAFLEWLTTPEGQRILISTGQDFPANPLERWAEFDTSPIETVRLGYLLPDALLLIERAGYR